MEIYPLIDAKGLGKIIDAVSSLRFIPRVLKLLLLTSITSAFDAYNALFFNRKSFSHQAEKYVQFELAKKRDEKRVAIITGANTGIGYLTAKNLAKAGHRVIIGCRNPIKAENALHKLKDELGENADIEKIELDLADFSSVRNFVKEFKLRNLPLHLIINNAGVMNLSSNEITKDDHELHFQVNYLSHFMLVNLLLPYLSTEDPRIIFLGSLIHYGVVQLSLEDLQPKAGFDPSSGYLYSKLAVTMFAHTLSSKLKSKGVFVGVADPGTTGTELFRSIPLPSWIWDRIMRPAEAGVLSTLRLALGKRPNNDSSLYYMFETSIEPNRIVFDTDYQEELWKMSTELTCSNNY